MFCLRELISLRGRRRREELETTDPTRLLALCQGQLRDSPIGSVDALCIQGPQARPLPVHLSLPQGLPPSRLEHTSTPI